MERLLLRIVSLGSVTARPDTATGSAAEAREVERS